MGFTKALGILLAFSLIKAGRDGAGYELHRMVQLATQKWLQMQDQIKTWQEKPSSVVADQFPNWGFQTLTIGESLLPHAQIVIHYGKKLEVCYQKYSQLLLSVASFDNHDGRYELCLMRRIAIYEMRKKLSGEDHPSTLTSLSDMARAYQGIGRWKTAHELHEQVVKNRERVLGAEHRDTLDGIHRLAITNQGLRQRKEAEKLVVQVIETIEGELGAESPRTLDALSHLCICYDEQGHYREAIALSERCIDLRTKIHGAGHPETLAGMSNLAGLYLRQGHRNEGVDMLERVAGLRIKIYGSEHPPTLGSMANLGTARNTVRNIQRR